MEVGGDTTRKQIRKNTILFNYIDNEYEIKSFIGIKDNIYKYIVNKENITYSNFFNSNIGVNEIKYILIQMDFDKIKIVKQ